VCFEYEWHDSDGPGRPIPKLASVRWLSENSAPGLVVDIIREAILGSDQRLIAFFCLQGNFLRWIFAGIAQ
jgi:hypothetical protein